MTLIKVCGITRPEDASMVATAGVDWIGLNFWPESKRHVDRMLARVIVIEARRCNPEIKCVGLFVNQSAREIDNAIEAATLDYVQLHGDESPVFAKRFGDRCIKALPLSVEGDLEIMGAYHCGVMLVDSPTPDRGGSGKVGDWDLAARAAARVPKLWLAGGLRPDNVAEAIGAVKPYGVDVASGVEDSPGIKNAAKVQSFVEAVRGVV
jgi:phosphoribosylanthranilate isomerase